MRASTRIRQRLHDALDDEWRRPDELAQMTDENVSSVRLVLADLLSERIVERRKVRTAYLYRRAS